MKIESILIALYILVYAAAFLVVVDATVQLVRAAVGRFNAVSRHQVSGPTNSVLHHKADRPQRRTGT